MTRWTVRCATLAVLLAGGPTLAAETTTAPGPQPATAKAPDAIDLYFENGSAEIRPEDMKLLDKASRLYAEGKPIVMIVAGSADQVGPADLNLKLSQTRADNVVHGLVERGIPAERFQILAKGVTDPPVADTPDSAQPRDRRVEITWR